VSSIALAKPKKKDAEPEKKGAGMMEESGKDPAETETADDEGQFVPGKKKPAANKDDEGEGESDADDEEEEGESAEERALRHEEEKHKKRQAEEEKPPEPEKPIKVRKTIGVMAELLVGFGKAPVPGPGDPTTKSATSFGVLVGGHYDVTEAFRVLLRVPWTTASFDGQSANALGVPEVAARLRLGSPGKTEWAVRLGIGIPIAQGNPDPTNVKDVGATQQAGVQYVADAANGWHDPELYQPNRLPISPALLFLHRAGDFRFTADLKAVVSPAVGGSIAEPSPATAGGVASGGTFEKKGVALTGILGGSASYEVLQRKYIALSAWAAYVAARPIEYSSSATAPSRFQFVLEPRILAQFGKVVPSVGFVLPLGGQLGGNIDGLRLHVDVVF
jgi:hypothetical protein